MLARGRYGVEWTERPEDPESSGLARFVFTVVLIAVLSLVVSLAKRAWTRLREPTEESEPVARVETRRPVSAPVASRETRVGSSAPMEQIDLMKRPPHLRNLLMRLEEAEKASDTEMAISTIEAIRELKGSPAADLDDALARRLGALNVRRLFDQKCAQWVKTVRVKRGDTLSRIASENGATVASTRRLNGGTLNLLRVGTEIAVLNHPRFNLVVHRRPRFADLMLNGKFFKRYDLQKDSGEEGVHEVTLPVRDFWARIRLVWKIEDRSELELLLPKGASVTISEL